MNMIDVYLTVFHSAAGQAHGILSKIDLILDHKASLNKYKKIEITPCILSDHNGTLLELNNKRNFVETLKS
jgi:hypothetical protein